MLSSSRSGGRGARGRRQPTIMDSPSFHSLSFLVDVLVFVFVFAINFVFFCRRQKFPRQDQTIICKSQGKRSDWSSQSLTELTLGLLAIVFVWPRSCILQVCVPNFLVTHLATTIEERTQEYDSDLNNEHPYFSFSLSPNFLSQMN